jgi:NAD(P)-dependent dehydrogenase (short-subunit alcohol dehydrogenase family)
MPNPTTHRPHDGRVALVTGAASGIGQALAVGLAERGATVIVAGHGDLTATTELIAPTSSRAIAAALDVSDPSSHRRLGRPYAQPLARLSERNFSLAL